MLRLLTYNAKFLPDVARIRAFWERGPHGMKDRYRAQAMAKRLVQQSPRWDVLCLQEVFDENQRARLRGGLAGKVGSKPAYRHFVAKSDDGDFLHEDSGLFLASRATIQHHRFDEFRDSAWPDSLSDKGVLSAVLDTRKRLDGTRLVIYTTHLQAGATDRRTREGQVKQLRRFMQRTLSRLPDAQEYAVIVCGDLNIIGEHVDSDGTVIMPTEEYGMLRSSFRGARDLYREKHGDAAPGATWDPQANPWMIQNAQRKERLDYVFAVDSMPNEHPTKPALTFRRLVANKVTVETFPHPKIGSLSDHFGVGVELDVE